MIKIVNENCENKYKNFDCFLEYTNFKGNLIKHKCSCCSKNYQKKLKKRFFNTHKLSNHNINQFVLLLRKGVYLYEYMDDSE